MESLVANSTNSTLDEAEWESNWVLDTFPMISWILIETVGNFLLLSMIWYERRGTDYEGTLLNFLSFYLFSCILLHNVVNENLNAVYLIVGVKPLPKFGREKLIALESAIIL